MQGSCLVEIQRLVDSARALLVIQGKGFDQSKVKKVKDTIWPQIISAVGSCPNSELDDRERGWLKYYIYDWLDRVRLEGVQAAKISVKQKVDNLPKEGRAPKVVTTETVPGIIPW